MSLYRDFQRLPRGTLIAGYWETYLICSVAGQLKPLSYDDQLARNYAWRDEMLAESTFYFLNNAPGREHGVGDTVRQYGATFIPAGEKHALKSGEVWVYEKAPSGL